MNRTFVVTAAAIAIAAALPARAGEERRQLEVAPLAGAWIPLGGSRSDFRTAPLTGVQLSYDLHPAFAVVGAFWWASPSALRLSASTSDLFEYDLGVRAQHAFDVGRGATVRPFLGIGEGLRTLHLRSSQGGGSTEFAFYSSAGVEVGYRALGAGVTVRHQMSRMAAPTTDTYQELAIFGTVGVRL
jgi:hypothetical protein